MGRSGSWFAVLLLLCLAPAAQAGAQSAQFRYQLGDFKVTALLDGTIDLGPGAYKGLPQDEIKALIGHSTVLKETGVETAVNAYLVDTGAHHILVDAGNASCYGWKLGGLEESLRAAGYKPDQIDTILITHLHGDHVCGLVKDGKPLFAKATVYAAEEEAAYWLDPQREGGTAAQARQSLAVYGKAFRTFRAGEQLLPGLTIVPAHGHTPGHTAYLFQSQGQALLAFGDIVHCGPVQFAHPEVSVVSDVDPAAAIASRQALFAKYADSDVLIAGSHLNFPGIGHLRKDGTGYVWLPLSAGK